jgi:glycosyltransferase involved in cell wall biosynthesis
MFGWEFPPHISGGLGTACYGLTRGLTQYDDTEVFFVVPRAWGDEISREGMTLIGANQVPVAEEVISLGDQKSGLNYIGIRADIVPYLDPQQYWNLRKMRSSGNQHFVEINNDGTIRFSGSYGPSLFREIRNYALVATEVVAGKEFDVIHAHEWLAFPAGMAASKTTGKPLIVHVHATEFDRTGGNVNPSVYAIERDGMEHADKVITVSNLTRKTVISRYGIPPEKVVTVYNAVEPLPERQGNKVQRIPGVKTVTFMGRITVQKGPEYFIEAAHMIIKKIPDVRFVMAGSGDMLKAAVGQVARLGITDRFHFTGFLENDEVLQLLDITDVFVMPSVSEPFGIAPLEAMLAGVPVIISRQSGVAEIIRYAAKIDFWDTCALADAIYGLLQYEPMARMFSRHGAVEAGSLKWKNAAGIVRDLYLEVTGSGNPGLSEKISGMPTIKNVS